MFWDGGTWDYELPVAHTNLNTLIGAGTSPVAAGDVGILLDRVDGGWTTADSGVLDNFNGVWLASPEELWLAGYSRPGGQPVVRRYLHQRQ